MSTDISPGPAFRDLFEHFEHTVFRLESRDRYHVGTEQVGFDRFLAGEREVHADWRQYPELTSWLAMVRRRTANGLLFRRVRVVSLPLTDYSRYGLWNSAATTGAGEDIRYLDRATALATGLPAEDYWLFDSQRSARLHFDDHDVLRRVELVSEPAEVVRHNHWRDIAWHHALRREDFAAEYDVTNLVGS